MFFINCNIYVYKIKQHLNRPVASGNVSNYFVVKLSKRVKMLFIYFIDRHRKKEQKL